MTLVRYRYLRRSHEPVWSFSRNGGQRLKRASNGLRAAHTVILFVDLIATENKEASRNREIRFSSRKCHNRHVWICDAFEAVW